MRSILLLLSVIATGAAQPLTLQGPLQLLRGHLKLTSSQIEQIQRHNDQVWRRESSTRERTQRLRAEITAEMSKPSPNVNAIGSRYAEFQSLCREWMNLRATARQRNFAILTDAQKKQIRQLEEYSRLAALVPEAEAANLYRNPFLGDFSNTKGRRQDPIGGILANLATPDQPGTPCSMALGLEP